MSSKYAQANFNAVSGHQKPYDVAYALSRLHSGGLLTGEQAQANRDAVSGHQTKPAGGGLGE